MENIVGKWIEDKVWNSTYNFRFSCYSSKVREKWKDSYVRDSYVMCNLLCVTKTGEEPSSDTIDDMGRRGYDYGLVLKALKYHDEIKTEDFLKKVSGEDIPEFIYEEAKEFYSKRKVTRSQLEDATRQRINKVGPYNPGKKDGWDYGDEKSLVNRLLTHNPDNIELTPKRSMNEVDLYLTL